jgi:hypothetical protein
MDISGLPSLDVVAQQLRDEPRLQQRRDRSGEDDGRVQYFIVISRATNLPDSPQP